MMSAKAGVGMLRGVESGLNLSSTTFDVVLRVMV
jgi:hypothetical protein